MLELLPVIEFKCCMCLQVLKVSTVYDTEDANSSVITKTISIDSG